MGMSAFANTARRSTGSFLIHVEGRAVLTGVQRFIAGWRGIWDSRYGVRAFVREFETRFPCQGYLDSVNIKPTMRIKFFTAPSLHQAAQYPSPFWASRNYRPFFSPSVFLSSSNHFTLVSMPSCNPTIGAYPNRFLAFPQS